MVNMNSQRIKIKSWNRFLTRNLVVKPEILGTIHQFPFENVTVSIKIPGIGQVNSVNGLDEVASVGARRAIDNQPSEIDIHKVDVEVLIPVVFKIPSEVLNRPANAYDLFSDKEQKWLNDLAKKHKTIAENAFEYWIRIVRWVCDDYRVGRVEVKSYQSGWSTYLNETDSQANVWIQSQVLHVMGYKTIKPEEWQEIQSRLAKNLQPPIYIELKHDAEENIRLGDYRRSLIDLAMACETFLRYAVLQKLPNNLNTRLATYIEEANVNQYVGKFFPEILDDATNKQFKNFKSDLSSLFDRRNKLVHMGQYEGIDEQLCSKFLQVTQVLLSLTY